MPHVRLFEHYSFKGRQLIIDNPVPVRYLLGQFKYLNEMKFNDIISSLKLETAASNQFNMCYLFQHARFNGNFKGIAFNKNRSVDALPDFNDLTSSVLLVAHDLAPKKDFLNIKKLAGDRINRTVDERLAGSPDVSRDGDVLFQFVIDMFEIGLFGTDLLKIEIPLKIDSRLFDYEAKIYYYIDLFIDKDHVLNGVIVWTSHWVQSGVLHGSVANKLDLEVKKSARLVEAQLNVILKELNWHQWNDVYLLPGRASKESADYSGNIMDDCTVVLTHFE